MQKANNLFDQIKDLLLKNKDYVAEDKTLLKAKVISDAYETKKELLELLLSDEKIKQAFFKDVNGVLVFDKKEFVWLIESKEFLPDSYTKYMNNIGLTCNDEYISRNKSVVLDFPFKDCLLVGGQDKDDQKRKEIFFNDILASDQITNLLAPKVFTNIKKYTKNSVENITDFNEEDNLIIKGNNLIVLSSLLKRYEGKVKCIYIDPPYNTGNDSFEYNDSFNHSTWLMFMKNRLELAKRLLADDGVIFVQSDDNEQAYLKVLMDEVFGRNNFYGMLIQLKGNTQNDSKTIQRNHEYIHVYVKNYHDLLLTYTNYVEKEVFKDEYHLKNKEDFSLTENKSTNRKNPEYIAHYYEGNENGATGNNNRLIDRPNLGYTIYYYEANENGIIENNKLIDKNNLGYNDFKVFKKGNNIIHAVALADHDVSNLTINSNENEIYMTDDYLKSLGYKIIRPPKRSGNVLGCWTWGIETKFKEYWNNDQILIKNNKNVIKKEFVDRSEIFVKNDKQYVLRPALLPIQSVVNISSASGTTHLKKLFDKIVFKNPKSENLIQTILSSCTKPNDLVLDFFLGSGTTAATAHKMGRRYIGVEQMGYIKDVVIERMKKVTNGEQGGISKSVKWNGGGNFVYLELKEDAQELIEKVKDATYENINQIKELILKDDRIVPYVFSSDISSLDEEFNTLNLNEQKQALIKLIDKNKLYVNYSSIEDAEYNISENDKNFNKAFYGDK